MPYYMFPNWFLYLKYSNYLNGLTAVQAGMTSQQVRLRRTPFSCLLDFLKTEAVITATLDLFFTVPLSNT